MKVVDLKQKLVQVAYATGINARRAKFNGDTYEYRRWITLTEISRDYITFIDQLLKSHANRQYHPTNAHDKLLRVVEHANKCSTLIEEARNNKNVKR